MTIVKFEEVSKSFKSKKVLDKFSFEIKKGEILGVVGPSGAGKSVFIKMLIGFLTPSSGKINFELNPSLGFSMQQNSLYPDLTVKQNLTYFSNIYNVKKEFQKEYIPILIKNLELTQYEKVLTKKLSGGTRKRVDLACSLVNNPDVLVLDEPFVGLDPALIESLSKFIVLLNQQGKTIVISSHRVKELSPLCSRIALVKNKTVKEIAKSKIFEAYT